MKLIREEIETVEFLVESKNGKKAMYIEGVFLQGDIQNRNGRMYPMATTAAATAGITSFFIRKDTSETLFIGKPRSNRVTGLTTETDGTVTIDFAEGTGSPFNGGDAVSLTVTGQDYYDFSHKLVKSINSTAGLNGYFSTRINVNYDYGDDNPGGIQTTFNNAGQVSYAEMRSSFVVGAQSATGLGAQGIGALYIQQVQTSGDA